MRNPIPNNVIKKKKEQFTIQRKRDEMQSEVLALWGENSADVVSTGFRTRGKGTEPNLYGRRLCCRSLPNKRKNKLP